MSHEVLNQSGVGFASEHPGGEGVEGRVEASLRRRRIVTVQGRVGSWRDAHGFSLRGSVRPFGLLVPLVQPSVPTLRRLVRSFSRLVPSLRRFVRWLRRFMSLFSRIVHPLRRLVLSFSRLVPSSRSFVPSLRRIVWPLRPSMLVVQGFVRSLVGI